MEPFETLWLGLITVLIGVSVWLAFIRYGDAHPPHAGIVHRLLYPSHYLNPTARVCPVCNGTNAPTDVRCLLPTHTQIADGDLSVKGELITKQRVRLWVLRVLIGLVTSSLLLSGRPLAIYAAIAAVSIWILLPLMNCQRAGRNVFFVMLIIFLAGIGVASFVLSQKTITELTTIRPALLPHLDVGPFQINLNMGSVTLAAIFLNGLAAVGVVTGVLMSAWSQLRSRATDHDGIMTVAFTGVLAGAVLLMALSMLQHLEGLALLYRVLAELAFGWLMVAFVERAVIHAIRRVGWRMINLPLIFQLPSPGSPRMSLRPTRGQGIFANYIHAVRLLIFGITRASLLVIFALLNIVIGAANALVRLVTLLVSWLLTVLVRTIQFLAMAFVTLVQDIALSLPALFRLGTSGFRIALYGPALILGASLGFATCASMSLQYLASGKLLDFATALGAFIGGAIGLAVAATFYADWRILRSFFRLQLAEYVPDAFIYFVVYLDLYGLSRLLFHLPSHFGLISASLNVIAAAAFVIGLIQQLAQRKTP